MTRIDFYILKESTLSDRFTFACRLVQKTSQLGHKTYIHCATEADALQLDKTLWSFQENSFLPHRIIGSGGADCAIEIGYKDEPHAPEEHHDLLINLGLTVPCFFSRFNRLAEIVIQEPAVLQATRNNYRFYTNKNYPLHNHQLR